MSCVWQHYPFMLDVKCIIRRNCLVFFQELHQKYKQRVHCYSSCMGFLTLSDPDSEDTDEADECCWGLEMDMGESALWGDTESLCCSSDPTPPPSTQFSCSDTGFLGGDTKEIGLVVRIYIMLLKKKKKADA